ncbi:MAG: hypothetical protein KGS61_13540, partial [Verrucomicrobia bacterium]|nr:hypothetical protein [Verrucomicrobiota bacterium]
MRAAVHLVLALCLGGELGQGQTTRTPARFLTLRDCIDLALKQNLDVQIERYAPEIARFTLEGSYGAYDPVFTFDATRDFLTTPSGVDPKKPGPDYLNALTTDSAGPDLRGLLPTGLQY